MCESIYFYIFWIGTWQNSMQCSKCGTSVDLYSCLTTFSISLSVAYLIISDFFLPFCTEPLPSENQWLPDFFFCCLWSHLDPILCVYNCGFFPICITLYLSKLNFISSEYTVCLIKSISNFLTVYSFELPFKNYLFSKNIMNLQFTPFLDLCVYV